MVVWIREKSLIQEQESFLNFDMNFMAAEGIRLFQQENSDRKKICFMVPEKVFNTHVVLIKPLANSPIRKIV